MGYVVTSTILGHPCGAGELIFIYSLNPVFLFFCLNEFWVGFFFLIVTFSPRKCPVDLFSVLDSGHSHLKCPTLHLNVYKCVVRVAAAVDIRQMLVLICHCSAGTFKAWH